MNVGMAARYTQALVALAEQQGPSDPFTRAAKILHYPFDWLLFPLILVQLVSTFVLGLLTVLTFGLIMIPLNLIWLAVLGPLLGTSWLWIKVPVSRPVLLLPGVVYAVLAGKVAAFMPEMGEWDSRGAKQALCQSWPNSWHIPGAQRQLGALMKAEQEGEEEAV